MLKLKRKNHMETMKIVQATFGVFHQFDLARELDKRGKLQKIYSTWPWARLKREGLPRSKVQTFPWTHLAQLAVQRYMPNWTWAQEELGHATALLFDEWLDLQLANTEIDALIALSGVGYKTGRHVQKRGGLFICDRGSTHHRFQEEIVRDELKRWGLTLKPITELRRKVGERECGIYDIADAITVPSQFAAKTFIEYGVLKEKIHVIPYGVRLDKFKPAAPPPTNSFEVLFVGQVGIRKGVPYLLEAFSLLNHPNKQLSIIGTVSVQMKSLLNKLPLEHVEFVGGIAQSELPGYMSRSHVIVLPSIEEGLALVQGQAMACGCPVLATMNTGSEDIYTDGVEGFIVPIRDVEALRDRMQQLADNPDLQIRMRKAALRRVTKLGGWHKYGDAWVDLLETLFSRKHK